MRLQPPYELEDILQLLPHRPPFLFVDCVTELSPGQWIEARHLLRPEHPHFAGHFPGHPIMPGALVAEALAQTSGLLLALSDIARGANPPTSPPIYYLASSQFKFISPAMPGDQLFLKAEAESFLGTLFNFSAAARTGDRLIATGRLTLARAVQTVRPAL